ncbi:UDP-N-acetylmuramate dehydrogenase [Alkalitalea saponilacus]|uniref:UDP-N-acetylenolpyruvoylglucosamine reductase n=1 Tax=Alkalitalea saponilacus TaxID=889453 RepID=A0A1T5D0B9_9BACT|nr:UDP-N-acetylmuramate dehydrogenase [Alkalitalea saponilacus]ASB50545.1 UDP-N-acetylenolpyruvoylglucosamine reductase [Alkalitalea saponilacus]SKB65165.1 UDP-N-acetylmuramate dehydrogenase [Alkalitalea saponilacus]
MKILSNYSLKHLNTFGIDANADKYIFYTSEDELKSIIESDQVRDIPVLILGGGSNLLFVSDFNGVVLHSGIHGVEKVQDNDQEVTIRVGSGVVWDDLVRWSVDNGFYGLENLSIIPGNVGAAPVQNIGAYGVEVKDVIDKVEGLYLKDASHFVISRDECQFDYRQSIFKTSLKGEVVITYVYFRLKKQPGFILDYGSLIDEVNKLGEITLENVRQAVINIRQSKLPDPEEFGNAGSFFKNPVISFTQFLDLQNSFPGIPYFIMEENSLVKIPAGWLIEKCGWKGKSIGNAGVHHKQALVLVNLGNASGNEIIELAERIETDVFNAFSIKLEREVNVVGF